MSNPVEDRFRSKDLELLRTGHYSDAQVIGGGRVWNVHKSIVCQRSGYMRDQISDPSAMGESKSIRLPPYMSEWATEYVLEFIYSGSINAFDTCNYSAASYVAFSSVVEDLRVDGLVDYVKEKLWDRLESLLGPVPTTTTARAVPTPNTSPVNNEIFKVEFRNAVKQAYKYPDNPCRLVLVDFAWAARGRLLGTPFIEELNVAHPQFGSHILTTLSKGPQSSLLKSDEQLAYASFCPKCALDGDDAPAQLQVFKPESW